MAKNIDGTTPRAFDVGGDRQDQLFDVLSHPHRRFTLRYLRTADAPLLVGELATEIEARESHRTVPLRSGDGREAVELSLVHGHLPKMDDTGFVQYDPDDRTVVLADRADETWAHLRAMTVD